MLHVETGAIIAHKDDRRLIWLLDAALDAVLDAVLNAVLHAADLDDCEREKKADARLSDESAGVFHPIHDSETGVHLVDVSGALADAVPLYSRPDYNSKHYSTGSDSADADHGPPSGSWLFAHTLRGPRQRI